MIFLLADIKLAAQDWPDPLGLRCLKEMDRAIDVAVIGDGDGLLANRIDVRDQLLHVAGAIQQRVVRMQMKVGELSHTLPSFYFRAPRRT